jgi:hypothetical protein
MSTDMESVIDKIKKCLALSESDNPNEAASALRQAQAMMRKYGVDEAAIAGSEVDQADVETRSANTAKPPAWEMMLVLLVGDAFGCRAIVVTERPKQGERRRSKAGYRYIGVTARAATAAYCATVLLRQLTAARTQHVRSLRAEAKQERWQLTRMEERSAGDAYCVGWLREVEKQVSRFANPAPIEAAIVRYHEDLTQGRRVAPSRLKVGSWDRDSISAGSEAGKAVTLNRPMSQSGGVPALGCNAEM